MSSALGPTFAPAFPSSSLTICRPKTLMRRLRSYEGVGARHPVQLRLYSSAALGAVGVSGGVREMPLFVSADVPKDQDDSHHFRVRAFCRG